MKTYRRITIEVTAEQYNGPEFLEIDKDRICEVPDGVYWFFVDVLCKFYPFVDGNPSNLPSDFKSGLILSPTDWIVTKQNGERIVVSDDEFQREYILPDKTCAEALEEVMRLGQEIDNYEEIK